MKKTVKKIFNWVSYVFMGLVLALIVYAVIMTSTGNEVSVFGYKMYVVATSSMEPTIPVKTVILSHEEDTTNLDIGTVITFDFESQFNVPNTHRIVGYYYVDSEGNELDTLEHEIKYQTVEEFLSHNPGCSVIGYKTKGDNPKIPDVDKEEVLFKDIKGVYVCNLNVITFLYSVLSNFFGFLFIILLPLFVLLIMQVVSIYKVRQQQKLDKEKEEKEKERKKLEEKIKEEAIKEYLESQQE